MTREEFFETYDDWSELIEFCQDNDLDACIGVRDGDDLVDVFIEKFRRDSSADAMYGVYDILSRIDFEAEYFYEDDYGEFKSLNDEDFCEFMSRAADEYDAIYGFDEGLEDDDEPFSANYSDPEAENWAYDSSEVDEMVDVEILSTIITCQ